MFCAVFDLDGTLADTSADLLRAANAQFIAAGFAAMLDKGDRSTALHGGRAMLSLGAERLALDDPKGFADAHYEPFLAHYREHICDETKLYPSAKEVIEQLRASGWKTAICTNKPIDLAEILLPKLGVDHLFDALIGVGSIPERKPDPRPLKIAIEKAKGDINHSVLIGDSMTDYKTAKAAGSAMLLVDFDETSIAKDAPDAPVVRDFPELGRWLEEWRKKQELRASKP